MIGVSKVDKSTVYQFYHRLLQQPSDFSTDKSDSLGLAIHMCTNVLQTEDIDVNNAISKTLP